MGSFLDIGKYFAVGLGSGAFGGSVELRLFASSCRWSFFDDLGYGIVVDNGKDAMVKELIRRVIRLRPMLTRKIASSCRRERAQTVAKERDRKWPRARESSNGCKRERDRK
jgi:hypothetical protein